MPGLRSPDLRSSDTLPLVDPTDGDLTVIGSHVTGDRHALIPAEPLARAWAPRSCRNDDCGAAAPRRRSDDHCSSAPVTFAVAFTLDLRHSHTIAANSRLGAICQAIGAEAHVADLESV